jgi:hypothetical protein
MAKVNFTIDELVYNTVLSGVNIYYYGELKTIDYVKVVKHTRQISVHCTDGSIFLVNQDEAFDFEVNNEKINKIPNKKKLKGK